MQRWATPVDRKQLESFLRLANYYREYVNGFAEVAAPLHALKGGGGETAVQLGEEEQTAFEEPKKGLTEAPVLVYPREGGGFILDTDASDKAIGGVTDPRWGGEGGRVWELCVERTATELLCD